MVHGGVSIGGSLSELPGVQYAHGRLGLFQLTDHGGEIPEEIATRVFLETKDATEKREREREEELPDKNMVPLAASFACMLSCLGSLESK